MLAKAIQAKRESKHIDFKEMFNPSSKSDWCEILKDIIAMANSGGGIILIGLKNNGEPAKTDVSEILKIDQAVVLDKIYSYTKVNFSDIEIVELKRGDYTIAAFDIGPTKTPIVFTQPGTYAISEKQQKTAFGVGTVYFRHGSKSELGNTDDLVNAIDRRLKEIRKEWFDGVRKVVQAPVGSSVNILPSEVQESASPKAIPIRIVEDSNAPEYHIADPNKEWPYRQMDVVPELNKRLNFSTPISPYDIWAVRRIYGTDKQRKFYYKSVGNSSPQFSNAFVDWLEVSCKEDPDFFTKARKLILKKQ